MKRNYGFLYAFSQIMKGNNSEDLMKGISKKIIFNIKISINFPISSILTLLSR